MKNIQVIDGADNCVYDVFQATDDEFVLVFPSGQDIAFIDEVFGRVDGNALDLALKAMWARRIPKSSAMGIDGLLFYGLDAKKRYYPTRKDEEACNPDGTALR